MCVCVDVSPAGSKVRACFQVCCFFTAGMVKYARVCPNTPKSEMFKYTQIILNEFLYKITV